MLNYFEFGPMNQEEISFKDIRWPFCSTERNHLCFFGRGHHEEHFCRIILNLNQ